MEALDADYYDHAIADQDSPHLTEPLEGPYAPLFERTMLLLRQRPPAHLVDLGCGTGRLAALIGPNTGMTLSYIGVDFSPAMINEARGYNADHVTNPPAGTIDIDEPIDGTFAFVTRDLRAGLGWLAREDQTYLIIETLEHLDNDFRLLARLPVDARLILSVPSFDSRAHVRHFPHDHDAIARYSELLELHTWERVWLPERTGFFHLMTGRLRP